MRKPPSDAARHTVLCGIPAALDARFGRARGAHRLVVFVRRGRLQVTVISYRNGTIACDSLCCSDGAKFASMTKIARAPDGSLAALSGPALACYRFLKWFAANGSEDGYDPEAVDAEGMSGFVVRPDGTIYCLDESCELFLIETPYVADGSGMAYALGAMAVGASAVEAVEAAIACCTTCGGPVISMKLEPVIPVAKRAMKAARKR
jgi:hypothetical protein